MKNFSVERIFEAFSKHVDGTHDINLNGMFVLDDLLYMSMIVNEIPGYKLISDENMEWIEQFAFTNAAIEFERRKENAITESDYDSISKENAARGWGFSDEDLNNYIAQYKEAMLKEDYHTMACIEETLTDCNFHTFNRHLSAGRFQKAREAM